MVEEEKMEGCTHYKSPGDLVKEQILIQEVWGEVWDFCISNKLPGFFLPRNI